MDDDEESEKEIPVMASVQNEVESGETLLQVAEKDDDEEADLVVSEKETPVV